MKVLQILTAAVLVLAATGAARADFLLTGTQHLDVTTTYGNGTLYDDSTANVLPSGIIAYVYVNNNATLTVSGGTIRGQVYANDESAVFVYSGSVQQELYAYYSSSVAVRGGNVEALWTGDSSSVAVSGGNITHLFNMTNGGGVAISGGSINHLYVHNTSMTTICGYDFGATGGLTLAGDKVLGTGVLTGKWFDGTTWAIPIIEHDASATIQLVPEPATMGLLAAGLVAILVRRRRQGK